MYIINMKPLPSLGRGYCYSERIFYIDAQNWDATSLLENYDRNGKIYHTNWSIHGPVDYKGEKTTLRFAFPFPWAWIGRAITPHLTSATT
jgi:Protein of unknown function (DUF1329)